MNSKKHCMNDFFLAFFVSDTIATIEIGLITYVSGYN